MARWRSRLPQLIRVMPRAEQAGLNAAADVAKEKLAARLRKGYTSGRFVTGAIAETLQKTDSVVGRPYIRVISPSVAAAGWEFGHINLFTRKYERVELWRPTHMDTRDEQARAFAKAFRKESRI